MNSTAKELSPRRRIMSATAQAMVLLAVIAASWFMLDRGWRKWADPLIDFGREVYVAWRISSGELLYRDLAWINGPLSPHLNATWFLVGGVSLRTLIIANILIAATFVLLMGRLLHRCGAKWGVGAALFTFALVFLSGKLLSAGNYNWIMPYSHELTHGLTLSAAAIVCYLQWIDRRKRCWAVLTGLACGAVFLTKVEVFAALAMALLAGSLLRLCRAERSKPTDVILMLGMTLAPALTVSAAFLWVMPVHDALTGVLGGWRFIGDPVLWEMPFFRLIMGIDEPAFHIHATLVVTGWWLALAGGCVVAVRLAEVNRFSMWIIGATLIWLVPAVLWLFPGHSAWREVARPLTLVMLGLLAAAAWSGLAARNRKATAATDGNRPVAQVVVIVWAIVLLARLGLHARLYHYGFALAAPAAMIVVAALVEAFPRWAGRRRPTVLLLRIAMLAAVCVTSWRLAGISLGQFRHRGLPIGEGADRLYTSYPTAVEALEVLDPLKPLQTLMVAPEGSMVNYLLRVRNPTGFSSLMPPEMHIFGEERVLERLKSSPPQVVLIIPRGVGEYGVQRFGVGYGEAIATFLRAEYQQVEDAHPGAVRAWRRIHREREPPQQ